MKKKRIIVLAVFIVFCLLAVYVSKDHLLSVLFKAQEEFPGLKPEMTAESFIDDENTDKDTIRSGIDYVSYHDQYKELGTQITAEGVQAKMLLSNLKELQKRDGSLDAKRVIEFQDSTVMNDSLLQWTVEDVFVTDQYDALSIDDANWNGLEYFEPYMQDEHTPKEGWTYLVVDVNIQNAGCDLSDFTGYGYAVSYAFMDEEGELYYMDNIVLYHSHQPGPTEQYALHHYDFKHGDSFENRYVLMCPMDMPDNCKMYLIINPSGNSVKAPEDSAMVSLEEFLS